MDVSSQETDWRSAAFRQKLVSQIDDAMRKAGVAHTKSSKDMEGHVFQKAKTREEYLSLVARLIIHFRDIHNKKSQASVGDPMNALQNLTGVAPAGAPGMGMNVRPPGAPMGGMPGLGQMTQQMNLPGQQQQQQQQPGTSVMAPHGMAGVAAPANGVDGPDTDEDEVVTLMLHNIATSSQAGRPCSAVPTQPLPKENHKPRKKRRAQMASTSTSQHSLSDGATPTIEQFCGLERAILRVQQKRLRAVHMLGRRIGTMDSNVTAALGSVKGSIDELCQAVRSVTQAMQTLADCGNAKNQIKGVRREDHRPGHFEGRLATAGSTCSTHTTSVKVDMLLSSADVSSGLMQGPTVLEELKGDVGITAVEPQEIERDLSSQSSAAESVVEVESSRPTCIVNGYGNDQNVSIRGKRKQSAS